MFREENEHTGRPPLRTQQHGAHVLHLSCRGNGRFLADSGSAERKHFSGEKLAAVWPALRGYRAVYRARPVVGDENQAEGFFETETGQPFL